ncbi:hypothetical protein KI387_044586, partial [Taxus chinensis]
WNESTEDAREGERSEEEVGMKVHETPYLSGEYLEDTVEKEVAGIIKDLVEHEVECSVGEMEKEKYGSI